MTVLVVNPTTEEIVQRLDDLLQKLCAKQDCSKEHDLDLFEASFLASALNSNRSKGRFVVNSTCEQCGDYRFPLASKPAKEQ